MSHVAPEKNGGNNPQTALPVDLDRTQVVVSMGRWDYGPLGDPGGRFDSRAKSGSRVEGEACCGSFQTQAVVPTKVRLPA